MLKRRWAQIEAHQQQDAGEKPPPPRARSSRRPTWTSPKSSEAGEKEMLALTMPVPESGTVNVKVRIQNPKGHFRSGERCKIRISN